MDVDNIHWAKKKNHIGEEYESHRFLGIIKN